MHLLGKDVQFEVDSGRKLLAASSLTFENAKVLGQHDAGARGSYTAQRLSGSNLASFAAASVYSPPALLLWRDILTTDLGKSLLRQARKEEKP